jgi:hypothetical protein
MTTTTVRSRFAAIAAKIEITPGSDSIAGSPAAADYVLGSIEWDFDPQTIPNDEFTGSLDRAPGIVGGLRPRLRMRVPLRGSGSAATAPDWGKLMRACGSSETVQASAVGAPTAAAAGTITTVTGAALFGTTPNQYRGLPLLVSGDQTFTSAIIAYSASRVFSLGEARASALTVSSLLQIPANVLYAPTSDESVYRTCTIYAWADGYHWRFGGGSGTWSLELTTGGLGFLVFEFRAQILSKTLSALPTGWNTVIRPTAPRFVQGRSQLNFATARCSSMTFNAGVTVTLPDNPESLEGYDPGVPVLRDSGGSIDPLSDTALGTALYDNFRAGTNMPLFAVIGSTPGNRFIATAPAIRAQNNRYRDREGLMSSEIPFSCDGADSGLFLACY